MYNLNLGEKSKEKKRQIQTLNWEHPLSMVRMKLASSRI